MPPTVTTTTALAARIVAQSIKNCKNAMLSPPFTLVLLSVTSAMRAHTPRVQEKDPKDLIHRERIQQHSRKRIYHACNDSLTTSAMSATHGHITRTRPVNISKVPNIVLFHLFYTNIHHSVVFKRCVVRHQILVVTTNHKSVGPT